VLIDARNVPAASRFDADVCIIGAGAAGLALAREFLGSTTRICVVESGGLGPDAFANSLNLGTNLGLPYYDLETTRERQFGGTTATWSGRCVPLDPIDFETRPWVPYSGWPIGYDDLKSYYARANEVCDLGDGRFDESLWEDLGLDRPGLDPALFTTRFWRIRVRRFGEAFRREFEKAENVHVLLHATATGLRATWNAAAVDHLELKTAAGNTLTVHAQRYVLAAGGIENARLLLASDDVETAGLGNGNGLVGRFFMEHPKCRLARIETPEPYRFLETWRKHFPTGQPYLWPTVVATAAAQREHAMLNSSLGIYYRSLPGVTEAALSIWEARRRRRMPKHLLRSLMSFLPVLDELPSNLVRRFIRRRAMIARPKHIYLLLRGEQAPNPESRVVLSDTRDALGQRRADLYWRLSEIDHRTAGVLTRLFAREMARLGLGQVTPDPWLDDPAHNWPLPEDGGDHHDFLAGGNHHIGTTRMADDPKLGVVDADCRVHGKANLYITGSSVFPTSGWANPTFTIVALALRLADHLKAVPAGLVAAPDGATIAATAAGE
jgi:choline dehydrogenase-like flavoprotein